MIDFNSDNYSIKELEDLKMTIIEAIDHRHNVEFNSRVKNICENLESLRKDYPWADFPIVLTCECCDSTATCNLFDIVECFNPDKFTF